MKTLSSFINVWRRIQYFGFVELSGFCGPFSNNGGRKERKKERKHEWMDRTYLSEQKSKESETPACFPAVLTNINDLNLIVISCDLTLNR